MLSTNDSDQDDGIRTDKVKDARRDMEAGTPTPLGKLDLAMARMLGDLAPDIEVFSDADRFLQREADILQYGPVSPFQRPCGSMQLPAVVLAATHD